MFIGISFIEYKSITGFPWYILLIYLIFDFPNSDTLFINLAMFELSMDAIKNEVSVL